MQNCSSNQNALLFLSPFTRHKSNTHTHKKIPNLKGLIANVQNICNLIGLEEYNFDRIVLLASILYSLTKNNNIRMMWQGEIEIY